MQQNDDFKKLIAPYEGDVFHYFETIGGHESFLNSYGALLEQTGHSLLDEIGPFEGCRFPSDVDVGATDKQFSWFFHYHDEEKAKPGHFHLYVSPNVFGDYTTATKTHVIAIEISKTGDFAGFFVPNNWVTKDHPRPAIELAKVVSKFHTFNNDYSVGLNIWLTAILCEFEDVVIDLLQQRDNFLGRLDLTKRDAYLENTEIEKICERLF